MCAVPYSYHRQSFCRFDVNCHKKKNNFIENSFNLLAKLFGVFAVCCFYEENLHSTCRSIWIWLLLLFFNIIQYGESHAVCCLFATVRCGTRPDSPKRKKEKTTFSPCVCVHKLYNIFIRMYYVTMRCLCIRIVYPLHSTVIRPQHQWWLVNGSDLSSMCFSVSVCDWTSECVCCV